MQTIFYLDYATCNYSSWMQNGIMLPPNQSSPIYLYIPNIEKLKDSVNIC